MEEKRLNELVVGKNRGITSTPLFTIDSYKKSQMVESSVCEQTGEMQLKNSLVVRLRLEPLGLVSLLPLRVTAQTERYLVVVHLCLSLLHHA